MIPLESQHEPVPSVLHVLPHPGGGGETYVDSLAALGGYRIERAYLTSDGGPDRKLALGRRAFGLQRTASRHTIVHLHGEVASTLFLPSLAVRRSVVTLHGLNLLRRLSGTRREAAKVNLRLIVRAASRTICVSEAERTELVAAVGARTAQRSVVINNGVALPERPTETQREVVRAGMGISADSVVGAWVGSLEEHKDPLSVVRASLALAREDARVCLLVVGDGPLRPQLEEEVQRSGSDAVRLLGYCRDVHDILTASDFFVLSSRREGFSYALLEAMARGLPVVVSEIPGNCEAVGDAGIVVPFGDTAGFAAAFEQLMETEEERRGLGDRGRKRIARLFHIDEMRRQTRQVYDEIVGRSSP